MTAQRSRSASPAKPAAAPAAPAAHVVNHDQLEAAPAQKQRRPRKPRASQDQQQRLPSNPEDDKRKVFIGNLPFSTTPDELTALFSAAGAVDGVSIARGAGGRAKGFAFVLFADEQAAKHAVQKMQGTVVGDREVNVEPVVAKPPREPRATELPLEEGAKRERRERKPRAAAPAAAAAEGEVAAEGEGEGETKQRRERRPRKRAPRSTAAAGEHADELAAVDDSAAPARRARAPRSADATSASASDRPRRTPSAQAAFRAARAERTAERKARLAAEGVPSPTTVYVGGVPHAATDAELLAFVQACAPGVAVASAKQVHAPGGRARGFAFVEVSGEADRDAVVAGVDGKMMEGRVVSAKVAMAVPRKEKREHVAGDLPLEQA